MIEVSNSHVKLKTVVVSILGPVGCLPVHK